MSNDFDFSSKRSASICHRMCAGESLRSICTDEQMPSLRTVISWLEIDSEFRLRYSEAAASRCITVDDQLERHLGFAATCSEGSADFVDAFGPKTPKSFLLAAKWLRARLPGATEHVAKRAISRIEIVSADHEMAEDTHGRTLAPARASNVQHLTVSSARKAS